MRTPLRIALINMPFASLDAPSLAITQLKSALVAAHGGAVEVRTLYLNFDFVDHMGGLQAYQYILGIESLTSGMGDWFFRQAAFPDQPDNAEEYFCRYHNGRDDFSQLLRRTLVEKRRGLEAFLDSLIDQWHLDEADIVGFTSLFAQSVSSFALARRLKLRRSGLLTLIGGPNCEFPMGLEIARHVPVIDYVFSGPGIRSVTAFVGHLLAGEMTALENIQGVYTKANADEPRAAVAGQDHEIDEVFDLDYESFLQAYEGHFRGRGVKPHIYFQTSRGCSRGQVSQCRFCGVNGSSMAYRSMKPENALVQFRNLWRYADRAGAFFGIDNIMPKSYLAEVLPKLDAPAGTLIFYESRSSLRREALDACSTAQVRFLQPGVEALSTPLLKLMHKGVGAFTNLRFLKDCLLTDVYPFWNMLLGFPDMSANIYEKYLADLPKFHHLPPPTGAYPIRFDRFSYYFDHPGDFGLVLKPYDFYELTYPFPEESIGNLAYYFADYGGGPYATDLTRWLKPVKEVAGLWIARWYHPDHNKLKPKLFFESDSVVYDSRNGTEKRIPVSPLGRRLLLQMETPALRSRLIATYPGEPIEAELRRLAEQGFLFEEESSSMSLVLTEPPRPFSWDLQRWLALAVPTDDGPPPAAAAKRAVGLTRLTRTLQPKSNGTI